MTTTFTNASNRRGFLKASAQGAAALVIAFRLPGTKAEAAEYAGQAAANVSPAEFAPNAWLRIDRAGIATILVGQSELGQGVLTSVPMILAEELDADWMKVRVEQAPSKFPPYATGTGGSGSVQEQFEPMRQAGAAARLMLITAAAKQWDVEPGTCRTEPGVVVHEASGRRAGYGSLVEAANRLPLPDAKAVPLKDPKSFRLIGKTMPKTDTPAKMNGSAVFGMDVRVPGMVYAAIARCPVFGGKLVSFDATKAKQIAGVLDVVAIEPLSRAENTRGGVAVIAENTWAAIQGRNALEVKWDGGDGAADSTEALRQRMRDVASEDGLAVRTEGDAAAAVAGAPKKVEARYELPYLAHATMEPMNCTVDAAKREIWAPTQSAEWAQRAAARVLGGPKDNIVVHTTLSGGGFGRRYQGDFVAEAAQVSKVCGRPVKVVWTREDDMRNDFYRQANYHVMTAGLDGDKVVAWNHHIISTSIREIFDSAERLQDPKRLAAQELDGAQWHPYAIPNVLVRWSSAKCVIPRAWWRSVAASFNAFAVESFIDELAHAAGIDPLQMRLGLLDGSRQRPSGKVADAARLKGVLNVAAEKAGWGRAMPKGRGLGIAGHYSFDSYVAHIADVSVDESGRVRVNKVTCAVDCGIAVNPDNIRAQMEGGVIYGLSAALKGEITFDHGIIKQGNFDEYPVMQMNDAPIVEVHIVRSTEAPTGTGEPGVPPTAPAVANAIFAATGKRVRRLPIRQV